MSSILPLNSSITKPNSFLSLRPNHQKTLQVALGIILLTGITLIAFSMTGYLPPVVGYVSAPVSVSTLLGLALSFYAGKKVDSAVSGDLGKRSGSLIPGNDKLVVLEKKMMQATEKSVSGTGSGTSLIYRHNGIEYVLKEVKLIELYAGRLYKLILGNHSPNIIFVRDGETFYVGSQFEPSFENLNEYHYWDKKPLPESDRAGLAKIIVASFLLGEVDLKGMNSESNVGIVNIDGSLFYFKIDHEQSFLFGGDYWRSNFEVDSDWKNKLMNFCKLNGLEKYITLQELEYAAKEIASIHLEQFESECDSCEQLSREYPEILAKTIKDKTENMFLDKFDEPKLKNSVLNRIRFFQQLVLSDDK